MRFFLRDTFGNLMKNINAHHERMEIVHAPNDFPTLPLWAMLRIRAERSITRGRAAILKAYYLLDTVFRFF